MSETKEKMLKGAAIMSYEQCDLERIAETYPEAMREPFLWLAEFAREQCGKNLDALEHKIKRLGLPTTAGTLSKIIRGRWKKNARNEEVPPVMSLENFINMVEKLRSDPEISEMVERVDFVETPFTWESIRNYIDVRRPAGRICKFGLIFGPTGAQKTASLKHYAALPQNNRSTKWMEAPYKAKVSHFISNLAEAYGVPPIMSISRKLVRIQKNFSNKKCLIIENIQRLYADPYGRELAGTSQEIFNYLQRIQDETGMTIILSATPEFYNEFVSGIAKGFFEQFEGRVGGRNQFLVLPQYTPMEDMLAIANKYGLQDAESHIEYLTKIARMPGRVRILFQTLQTAKEDATESGQALTIEHVREVMPESAIISTTEA